MTIDQLAIRLGTLGAGDRSVIVYSASNPKSIMTTSPGTPNDALWSEMETAGWTKRVNAFADMPPEVAKLLRGFELTEAGAAAVKAALAKTQSR